MLSTSVTRYDYSPSIASWMTIDCSYSALSYLDLEVWIHGTAGHNRMRERLGRASTNSFSLTAPLGLRA